MPVVGRAEVLVSPSFKGAQNDIKKQLSGSTGNEIAKTTSTGVGSKIVGGLGKALKIGLATTGLGAGAILGGAITKGFGRLNAIEQARAKLLGLGNSVKTVDGIMKNALASVKGTAFGLDEAATTAGAVVAAGVKPGKELEGVLKTVADTATIAGTSMSDMGQIFGSVAARGKLQGDDMMQLTSKGVPVLAFLAKHYGITAKAASDMVSKGKVDFKNFSEAMKENIGGAAKKSGETTTGAWKNMWASISRTGANALSGIFPKLQGAFTGITDWLAPVEKKAKEFGQKVGDGITFAADAIKLFVGSFTGKGADVDLGKWMNPIIDAGAKARDIFDKLVPIMKSLVGFIQDNAKMIAVFAAGFVAWQVATAAATRVLTVWNVGVKVAKAAMLLWKVATGQQTIAQLGLNAAMKANIIGLIITLLAALVVGIIYAYKHSETFRKIVQGAWSGIKTVVSAVVGWFVNTAWPLMKKVFNGIGDAAKFMWTKILRPTFDAFKSGFQTVGRIVRAVWSGWLSPVFQLVGAIIKWLWRTVAEPYFRAFGVAFRALGSGIQWVWKYYAKPTIAAFGALIRWLWQNVAKPTLSVLKSAWDGLGKGLKWTYDHTLKPVVDSFGRAIKGLVGIFKAVVDGIKKHWDDIKRIASAPIRFVIETVINGGLIKGFNKLADVFGTKHMSLLPVPKFATGGPMHGPGTGTSDSFLIRASNGEHMWTAREVANFGGHGAMERFRSQFRGFRAGGRVDGDAGNGWPLVGGSGTFSDLFASKLRMAEAIAGVVFNIFQRGFRPATSYSGTSHQGDAVDLGPVRANIVAALRSVGIAAWDRTNKGNWAPHIHAVPLPGSGFAAGSGVWQAQDYLRGGDGLGGRDNGPRGGLIGKVIALGGKVLKGFSSIGGWLKDKFTKPLQLLEGMKAGWFGQLLKAGAKKVGSNLVDFGEKLLPFDNGGLLMPGVTRVYNGTGKPEPVFTDDQWQRMQGGGSRVLNVEHLGYDPRQIFTEWDRRERHAQAMANLVGVS